MAEKLDVLVIGGGVVGVAAAYYLARSGRSVTLLEKHELCAGSSYGNAGLIVPSHAIPLAAPGVLGQGLRWLLSPESPFYIAPRLDAELVRWLWRFRAACREEPMLRAIPILLALGRASMALFEELAGQLDFEYRRLGWLLLFNTRRGLEAGVRDARLLGEVGVVPELLDGAGVRRLAPEARASVIGGMFFPEDAQVIPDRLVLGLARLAEKLGVSIRPSTEVLGFETNQGRISQVATSRGSFRPAEVVLAAGAWSSKLARLLGVRLLIESAKGYSLTIESPAAEPSVPLYLTERKVAITRWKGAIRVSGTLELSGLDLRVNRRRVSAITRAFDEYLSEGPRLEGRNAWAGLRPATPDGLPIIGRSRLIENLVVASGHGMLGVTFGPITGKLVAQILCGEPPALDLAPFRVERFGSRSH